MSLTIRKAESLEDLLAIAKLRYRVAIKELQRDSEGIDHEQATLSDSFDKTAQHFVADADGELVGAVRLNLGRDGPLPNAQWFSLEKFNSFNPDQLSVTDRLVVQSEYRSGLVPGRLAMACYEYGSIRDIEFDFVLTRPHLVSLYQQMGHRAYSHNVEHPKYGTMTPMTAVIRDTEFLKTIRSPFYRLARRLESNDLGKRYFETNFPEWAKVHPSSSLTEKQLWSQFGEALSLDHPSGNDGFVSGLNREEIARLLRSLTPLAFKKGEAIVKQGDIGQGLFVLLEGKALVQCENAKSPNNLGELGPGDLFGEMSFLNSAKRNASVFALEDTRVVILTPQQFEKLKKVEPQLSLKILSNLFATVAGRYDRLLSGSIS